MSIEVLGFSEPFFTVKYVVHEQEIPISDRTILLNLSVDPIIVENQKLTQFQSLVVLNTRARNIEQGVLVERFDDYGNKESFLESIKKTWPLAYDIRKEERLRGKAHYMSPKTQIRNIQFSMYHTASVPLNVGLHKDHVHLGGEQPQEIHTQIVGFGKMQQFRERDLETLYLEDFMAPGATHKPMFDEALNYPWHQYETITPGVIMAVEILTSGNSIPVEPSTPTVE